MPERPRYFRPVAVTVHLHPRPSWEKTSLTKATIGTPSNVRSVLRNRETASSAEPYRIWSETETNRAPSTYPHASFTQERDQRRNIKSREAGESESRRLTRPLGQVRFSSSTRKARPRSVRPSVFTDLAHHGALDTNNTDCPLDVGIIVMHTDMDWQRGRSCTHSESSGSVLASAPSSHRRERPRMPVECQRPRHRALITAR